MSGTVFLVVVPIGQERNEVRRHPWVSYVIVALNVVVQLLLAVGFDRHATIQRIAQAEQDVVAYLDQHPEAPVPPELAALLDDEDLQALAASRTTASSTETADPQLTR